MFFALFMKNKDCIDLIFKLLQGLPDLPDLPTIEENKKE
jgi:hypothetical protein